VAHSRGEFSTLPIGAPRPLETEASAHVSGELRPGHEVIQHKKFEIVEAVGEGGMGRIYKAYDATMKRYIALKILKPDVPESQRRRFHREAVIAANFSHPNLVRVLEVGRSGSLTWFAMEHLRGRDVGDIIVRRKQISFRVLVDIFSQTLDALHYIHTRGITHCDIKPENIFITRDSYDRKLVIVKLIDFGIARSADGPVELQTHLTGDPRYMAPEQAVLNGPLDHRADLYGLGLTFYEVATCRHPFEDWFGLPPQELLKIQRTQVPEPPSESMPAHTPAVLNHALDRFVARACAKEVDRRFQSAREMQRELREILKLLGG